MDTKQRMQSSYEAQTRIRHNADELKSTFSDLYTWEKDMKDKEKVLNESSAEETIETPPVRSLEDEPSKPKVGKETGAISKSKIHQPTATKKTDHFIDQIENNRSHANVIKERGNKYVKYSQFDKAAEEYTKAIEIYSKDAVFFANRALCYIKLEKYHECIKDCSEAIRLDNLSVKAYYRRMLAYEHLGQNDNALEDCTSVLLIDSHNKDAKQSLERLNQKLNKHVKLPSGPSFSIKRNNIIDIAPVNKPPYARSKKLLRRVPITEVVGTKDNKNYENSNIQISDEVIDKLFNSDCGPFVEVKKPSSTSEITPRSQSSSPTETYPRKRKNLSQVSQPDCLLSSKKSLPPPPKTTAQFYAHWKELSGEQKYHYLKSIESSKLCKILGAGFDSDTLSDIIRVMQDYYVTSKEQSTAQTLLEVSKNNQVGILSLLFSTEDRKALSDILNYVRENELNVEMAAVIARNFNIK